ncbi:hypothetical protein [Hoeflea sp.]|uniref:hypothetical protein n=1 Tax=Hoeflea sp. TaxID=1940281 RepID=UPI002AFED6BD|nr:hypothetical protein [Hoeflea sp.]
MVNGGFKPCSDFHTVFVGATYGPMLPVVSSAPSGRSNTLQFKERHGLIAVAAQNADGAVKATYDFMLVHFDTGYRDDRQKANKQEEIRKKPGGKPPQKGQKYSEEM